MISSARNSVAMMFRGYSELCKGGSCATELPQDELLDGMAEAVNIVTAAVATASIEKFLAYNHTEGRVKPAFAMTSHDMHEMLSRFSKDSNRNGCCRGMEHV
jgi:hypothetical protein